MRTHAHPITDTLRDVIHQANEPNRLFLQLLAKANDNNMDLSEIAALGEALQEVTSARIDAIFQVVDRQIGVIKFTGVPCGHELVENASELKATLEKPKKNEP